MFERDRGEGGYLPITHTQSLTHSDILTHPHPHPHSLSHSQMHVWERPIDGMGFISQQIVSHTSNIDCIYVVVRGL